MKQLFYITALLLLFSCAPQKRLARLIKKHPELQEMQTVIITDTIKDTIVVSIPGVSVVDTFTDQQIIDTVYIDTNQLHVTIWRDTVTKQIVVKGNCDPIVKRVPYQKVVTISKKFPVIIYRKPRDRLRWFLGGFWCGLIFYLLIQFAAPYFRK